MEGQSVVKVGMCVLIHGLETRKDLNDRWGEVLKKCDGMDPERFLVKAFDPDLGFGRGDWSTETVRIKTVNLEESLIGPTTHEGMACGHSNPRHDGSFCDEKLVASQILHGDEDMLSWPEIKEKWGSCVNFALKHGFDPMDWDRFDELRELSTRIKAKRQQLAREQLAREERARREREMESQRRTPPDNGRIDLVVEGEAANGAAPAAPAAAVENEIKAFIGGLASTVTEEHLKKEFKKYGIVGANVKVKRYNGRSKVFGFVSFETEEGRQKAVDELHGKEVWGKQIKVAPAMPKDPNAPRPRRGRGTKPPRGRGADQGTEATKMPYKGTNSQGNNYTTPGGTNKCVGSSYHYSNQDGSHYYANDNGSTYYNNGKGSQKYTRSKPKAPKQARTINQIEQPNSINSAMSTIKIPNTLDLAVKEMCQASVDQAVKALAAKYGFDHEEAMRELGEIKLERMYTPSKPKAPKQARKEPAPEPGTAFLPFPYDDDDDDEPAQPLTKEQEKRIQGVLQKFAQAFA